MAATKAPAPVETFQAQVERALVQALSMALEPADRIKALAVAVRYLAVKNKLVTGVHGSAYDDDDLDVEA